jgi:hypothetical protein
VTVGVLALAPWELKIETVILIVAKPKEPRPVPILSEFFKIRNLKILF